VRTLFLKNIIALLILCCNSIAGSPFKCEVLELGVKEMRHMHRKESRMVTVRGEGLKDVVVGSTAYFDVDPKGMDGRIDMEVVGKCRFCS